MTTGDTLVIESLDGELRVRTLAAAVREAQAIIRSFVPANTSLAAELIAERRAKAARD